MAPLRHTTAQPLPLLLVTAAWSMAAAAVRLPSNAEDKYEVQGARRLLTRSGDDGHAKAGAKTGGDLVIVRTQ